MNALDKAIIMAKTAKTKLKEMLFGELTAGHQIIIAIVLVVLAVGGLIVFRVFFYDALDTVSDAADKAISDELNSILPTT